MASSLHEPYFSLSRSRVLEQYNKLATLGTVISYSVKTNPRVAPILEDETDAVFNIHALHDLDNVKDRTRIWYLLQASDKQTILTLLSTGITRFIADNSVDMNTLLEVIQENNTAVDLLLRMKLKEHTIHTGRYFVFGMGAEQIKQNISVLRKHPLIKNLGIHCHRKTQNISEWNLRFELSQALDENTLRQLDIVNIGGGLPARYKNSSDAALPSILAQIQQTATWLRQTYNIITHLEPGRFLSASPVCLHVFVKAVYDNNIVVNASVYNAALDSILFNPTRLIVQGETDQGTSYTIKGCTPDSMDIFRYDVKFAQKPNVGDQITFNNAGAYNFSTNYYGLPIIQTRIVE